MTSARAVPNKRLVVATERLLFPPTQGYRARIIELLRSLHEAGFRVTLVSRRIPDWRARLLTRLLVDELVAVDAPSFQGGRLDAYDCAPFQLAVANSVRRTGACGVIAEFTWMAPCLDLVPPGVVRILDVHDLLHVRGEMYGGLEGGAWVACSRHEEARMLARADVVSAIQRNEQQILRTMVPGRTVICVPHPCRPTASWPHAPRMRDIVAFVGSDNAGNVAGIEAFVREAWPLVRAARPGAELRIYGKVVRRLAVEADGVRLVGPVRRLGTAYGSAKVVINPVTLGTGLKIKSVEALARGRALVTTACGADGLEDGSGSAFRQADDPRAFAGAVIELLANAVKRAELERAARDFVARAFSPEACLRELLLALRPQPFQVREGNVDPDRRAG